MTKKNDPLNLVIFPRQKYAVPFETTTLFCKKIRTPISLSYQLDSILEYEFFYRTESWFQYELRR